MSITVLTGSILTGIDTYVLESKNVKVFPCAYRGYYNATPSSQIVFDPEARSNTEYNFANIYSKTSSKDSYVISFTGSILKCVIGGYYFELSAIDPADFLDGSIERALIIRLQDITLTTGGDDGTRITKALQSYNDADNYLDTLSGASYLFTGLAIIGSDDIAGAPVGSISASLIPFRKNALNVQEVNWEVCTIDTALSTSQGSYAVRGGQAGLATGKSSVALGYLTTATADNALAGGDNSEALAKNSFTFGDHVTTESTRTEQFVIGRYNVDNATAAFIISNGTNITPKNICEVSDAGHLNIAGNTLTATGIFTINNNLIVNGQGTDDLLKLKLANVDKVTIDKDGGITTASGTIATTAGTAYLFNTSATGLAIGGAATTINIGSSTSGTTTIKHTKDSTASDSGALVVKGGVGIANKLFVGTDLNVGGSTILGDSATADTTTINGIATINGHTTGNTKTFIINNGAAEKFSIDSDGDVSATTYNGLTNIAKATGFQISGGGTTSKTLTVNDSITLAGSGTATINVGFTAGATSTYTGTVTVRSAGSSSTTIVGPDNETTILAPGTYGNIVTLATTGTPALLKMLIATSSSSAVWAYDILQSSYGPNATTIHSTVSQSGTGTQVINTNFTFGLKFNSSTSLPDLSKCTAYSSLTITAPYTTSDGICSGTTPLVINYLRGLASSIKTSNYDAVLAQTVVGVGSKINISDTGIVTIDLARYSTVAGNYSSGSLTMSGTVLKTEE